MKRSTALIVGVLAVAGLTFAGCDKAKKAAAKAGNAAKKSVTGDVKKGVKKGVKDAGKAVTGDTKK